MKVTPFWYQNKSGNIEIDEHQLKNFLAQIGFSSFAFTTDMVTENQYIIKKDNLIEPIIPIRIHEATIKIIESGIFDKKVLPEKNIGRIVDRLMKTKSLEKKGVLTLLPELDNPIVSDTKDEACFIYKNTAVVVTKQGINLIPPQALKGYIWKSQVIERGFELKGIEEIVTESVFYKFLRNVSKSEKDGSLMFDDNRFHHLLSLLGYMLHGYKDRANPRAVILMDSSVKGEPKGRTGKGLIIDGIGKLRKTIKEDGKSFQDDNRFKFSLVTPDSKILFIDDVKANINFESFFSAISEGIMVEPKYINKFFIPFEMSPKIVLSTNYSVLGHGASHDARRYEFSLSHHYNDKNTPIKEFGHRFFDEWDSYQWNLFDSLMMHAVQKYLSEGVTESEKLFINRKKLVSETSSHFEDWISNSTLEPHTKYDKRELYSSYSDYYMGNPDCDQPTFTRYLKNWAIINKYTVEEPRSDDIRYIRFFT